MISEQIYAIWSRELKLEGFDVNDDFFDLGGHSLIMVKIQAAIVDEFNVEVPMDELFRRPTVTDISEYLEHA